MDPKLARTNLGGGYLPEVRAYFVREFKFDQFVANSTSFQEEIENAVELGNLGSQPDPPASKFRPDEETGPQHDTQQKDKDVNQLACEQLRILLITGSYEYLRHLINDLLVAERLSRKSGGEGGTTGEGK